MSKKILELVESESKIINHIFILPLFFFKNHLRQHFNVNFRETIDAMEQRIEDLEEIVQNPVTCDSPGRDDGFLADDVEPQSRDIGLPSFGLTHMPIPDAMGLLAPEQQLQLGAANVNPEALSQIVNSMVHQALNNMRGHRN